jgi:hypothetical protein
VISGRFLGVPLRLGLRLDFGRDLHREEAGQQSFV